MKQTFLFASLGALALLAFVACSSPQSSTEKEAAPASGELVAKSMGTVRNVHQLGDVWFGGQPSTEDFRLIKDAGVKTVINLRHDAENPDLDEASVVAAMEMEYTHIPFSGQDQLTDDVFDSVRQALQTGPRPLLLHCASANRVGATWLPYRVLDEGVPFADALLEAQAIGLRSPGYEERARQYIAAQQSQ